MAHKTNGDIDSDDGDLSIGQIKQVALEELETGPKHLSHVQSACFSEYGTRVDDSTVWNVLEQLRLEGEIELLADPENWFQLAGWNDRPLRVLAVSNHTVKLDGVGDLETVWFDESLRAARHEHGIEDSRLVGMATTDDRRQYLISTAQLDVLESYRSTLRRLAADMRGTNDEKAEVFDRLSDATRLEDEHERRETEVILRDD
ncbi:hypothetical protein [Natronorubrum sp. DTA7]|uniref:hypothetical protein n=1 Tax=Natronorubrum sp. DTA7 TaxID=3447016 RepID=UPI003F87F201